MDTLRPHIKSWDCISHDPIEEWKPEDPSMVDFWCNVVIGIQNQEGCDNFQIHVVTEKMIPQIDDKNYMLVIPYYENWNQVLSIIESRIKDITGINWQGISLELSKIFRWEYAN